MSIFQIKELWATNVGNGEEFDKNSICVGNIDSSSLPETKIAVGSFEGILRVYKPQIRNYSASDMILEKNLGHPILQIDCGRFSYASDTSLAILHSRKLVVASITSQEDFANYRVLYDHAFDRNAYNFVSGTFGKSSKMMICVQSVDGALFFFEQELLVFQIQLPDFLIPGPIIYASNVDSLIIANSNLELECYRFSSLQAFTNNNIAAQKAAQQQDMAKSKLEPDWICNVGEQTSHLVYHYNKISKKYDIVAVGEQTFFVLNETEGKIRFQKRLEYSPSCLKTYHVPNNKDIFEGEDRGEASTIVNMASQNLHNSPCFSYIMGSFSHYLMVYKDVQLVLTAKTQTAPIYANITKVENKDGLIVTLSDNGWLQIVYLGPDNNNLSLAIQSENQDMNYENHEDEKQAEPIDKLVITPTLSSFIEQSGEYIEDPQGLIARNDNGKVNRMRLKITLSYQGSSTSIGIFKNTQLQVNLPINVFAEQTVFKFENLNFSNGRAQTPPVIQMYLYPTKKCSPIDSKISITLTAQQTSDQSQQSGGNLRTSIAETTLPMAFFVTLGLPGASKEASDFKINLVMNKNIPSTVSLFEDAVEMLQAREFCTNKKQMTFMYHNKIPVSMLISKDDLKVRIQSPDFSSLWYVLTELVRRVSDLYSSDESFEIQFTEAIPLNELFSAIDEHYQYRAEIAKLKKVLEDRSYQFRVIQKRLLNRFKDKNPSPLNNLDFLLNHTYMQIIDTATQIEDLRLAQKAASVKLSSAVEIILLLLRIRFKMTTEEYDIMRMHLSPTVDDDSEHGWEDVTNAAMTSLLKTCLSKGGKNNSTNVNSQIKTLQDVGKLKQHITLVCDRISKGAKIEF